MTEHGPQAAAERRLNRGEHERCTNRDPRIRCEMNVGHPVPHQYGPNTWPQSDKESIATLEAAIEAAAPSAEVVEAVGHVTEMAEITLRNFPDGQLGYTTRAIKTVRTWLASLSVGGR